MNRQQIWDTLRSCYRAGQKVVIAVDEEFAMEMLEILPPVYLPDRGFGLGEPYTHDANNQPVRVWFIKERNQWYAMMGTQAQARKRFAGELTIWQPTLSKPNKEAIVARIRELHRQHEEARSEDNFPNARDYPSVLEFQRARNMYITKVINPLLAERRELEAQAGTRQAGTETRHG